MSNLTDKFQQFVGQTVKHPNRVTCDICDTSSALSNAAFAEGLMLVFTQAGQQMSDFDNVNDPNQLLVELTENDQGRLVIADMSVT